MIHTIIDLDIDKPEPKRESYGLSEKKQLCLDCILPDCDETSNLCAWRAQSREGKKKSDYYARTLETRRAYQREYVKKHPEAWAAYDKRYREKLKLEKK